MRLFIFLIMTCFYASSCTQKSSTPKAQTVENQEKSTESRPQIGKAAPDFQVQGHDGKTYSLKELKGKYIVLEWFNDGCPYVKKHYNSKFKNMQTLQQRSIQKAKAASQELVWLAVASSSPGSQGHLNAESAAKIKKEWNGNMTSILLDESGQMGQAYLAKTTPHMFIIDPQGILRYMGGIDDKASTSLDSLKEAKNYVALALEKLFAGEEVATTSTRPYGCSVKY